MPTEAIEQLTRSECEVAISQLNELAARLSAAIVLMEDGQDVWVFRKPSLRKMLDRIPPFQTELEASFRQIQLGDPYGPETTKGRKRAAPKKTAGRSPARKASRKKKEA